MLVKMTPEQVSKFWGIIKYAVEESLPPVVGESPDKMNRILSSALSGQLDVWAMYDRSQEDVKLEAVAGTRLSIDEVSGTRSLLIYFVYGYREVSNGRWDEGLETITKYAKSKGCSRIVAYSSIPHLIQLAQRLGADTQYTFISFGLD